jgi:hypothetical protein
LQPYRCTNSYLPSYIPFLFVTKTSHNPIVEGYSQYFEGLKRGVYGPTYSRFLLEARRAEV